LFLARPGWINFHNIVSDDHTAHLVNSRYPAYNRSDKNHYPLKSTRCRQKLIAAPYSRTAGIWIMADRLSPEIVQTNSRNPGIGIHKLAW
jgi:hypothetical protein